MQISQKMLFQSEDGWLVGDDDDTFQEEGSIDSFGTKKLMHLAQKRKSSSMSTYVCTYTSTTYPTPMMSITTYIIILVCQYS